jgi:hypothetical protein
MVNEVTHVTAPAWRTSSYSGNDSNCVEVAFGSQVVGIRDSKNPAAGDFSVTAESFRAFVRSLQARLSPTTGPLSGVPASGWTGSEAPFSPSPRHTVRS